MAANPQSPRVTRSVEADDVKHSLPQTLSAVARDGERVIVEEDGVAVAAIVSLDDLKQLARLDARRVAFFETLERIGAAFADEDPVESDRLAALALAEAREQMRRERAAKSSP
jgi:antitoxin (DNA-binding transcriptional repressor) of toxin-antitoxin stability system